MTGFLEGHFPIKPIFYQIIHLRSEIDMNKKHLLGQVNKWVS